MRVFLSIVLVVLCLGASFAGGAAWTAYSKHQEAAAAALKADREADAFDAVRTDPIACSSGIPEAIDLCKALGRFDLAAQSISSWAEPVDRPDLLLVLRAVRDSALKTEAPSWISQLQWSEEAALRRARALEAANTALLSKAAGPEKTALSAKLAGILKDKLLQDSAAP